MPRHTHPSGRRLQESKRLVLVEKLLERGARTKTVERLTGLSQVPIRDVYHEMFGTSPQKGPSGYSHTYFTATQVIQFHSSLAHVCIEAMYQARPSPESKPSAPELGTLYCEAYDRYLAHLSALNDLIEPMCFERFSHFALLMSKKSVLGHKTCIRCDTPFVAVTKPSVTTSKLCPLCRLTTARTCAKCDTYVAMDTLDVSPKRRPMCKEHAFQYRSATFGILRYAQSDDQSLPQLTDETSSEGRYLAMTL